MCGPMPTKAGNFLQLNVVAESNSRVELRATIACYLGELKLVIKGN